MCASVVPVSAHYDSTDTLGRVCNLEIGYNCASDIHSANRHGIPVLSWILSCVLGVQ